MSSSISQRRIRRVIKRGERLRLEEGLNLLIRRAREFVKEHSPAFPLSEIKMPSFRGIGGEVVGEEEKGQYSPHSPADVAELRDKIKEALTPFGIAEYCFGKTELFKVPITPPGVSEAVEFISTAQKKLIEELSCNSVLPSFRGSESSLDDMIVNRKFGHFVCDICKKASSGMTECNGELICSACKEKSAEERGK